MGARVAAVLFVFFVCRIAITAELREIKVEYEDGRYHLTSHTYFNATQAQLYNVLIDYDLFPEFHNSFVESRNVPADSEGRPGFFTRMEACVVFFCKAYIREGRLELEPEEDIVAIGDPEKSNFRFSRERWRLIPEGDGTLLIYDFEMEPDFWVPPVIGPYLIKRSLREGGTAAVDRIEAIAIREAAAGARAHADVR